MYKSRGFGIGKLSIFVILTIWGVSLLTQKVFPNYNPQDAESEKQKILLAIAVCLDDEPTTLSFTITNNSKKDFETTPITTNYNRLVIVTPKGEEREMFVWKDGINPVVIKPSEEKIWKINISKFLIAENFKETGDYQLYWKVNKLKSDKLTLIKEKRADEEKK